MPDLCQRCNPRWYRYLDTDQHREEFHNPARLGDANFRALFDRVVAMEAELREVKQQVVDAAEKANYLMRVGKRGTG